MRTTLRRNQKTAVAMGSEFSQLDVISFKSLVYNFVDSLTKVSETKMEIYACQCVRYFDGRDVRI